MDGSGSEQGLQPRDHDAPARGRSSTWLRCLLFERSRKYIWRRHFRFREFHGIDAHQVAEPALRLVGQLVEVGLRHGRLRPDTERRGRRGPHSTDGSGQHVCCNIAFLRKRKLGRIGVQFIVTCGPEMQARAYGRVCAPKKNFTGCRLPAAGPKAQKPKRSRRPSASWEHRITTASTFRPGRRGVSVVRGKTQRFREVREAMKMPFVRKLILSVLCFSAPRSAPANSRPGRRTRAKQRHRRSLSLRPGPDTRSPFHRAPS